MSCRCFAPPLLAAVALLFLAPALVAHIVDPKVITLRPGTHGEIFVIDQATCAADIRALTTDPSVATIYAINMATGKVVPGDGRTARGFGIAQLFVVIAANDVLVAKSATIEICWVGEDVGTTETDCLENTCSPYTPERVIVTVDPLARSSSNQPFGGLLGDPVNTESGECLFDEPADLSLRSRMPIEFARHYSSRFALEEVPAGSLGPNWRHSFEWTLTRNGNYVEIVAPDGRELRFERGYFDSAFTQVIGQEPPSELIEDAGYLKLRDVATGRIYWFDGLLRLVKIEDGRGNALSLTYTAGQLTGVDDGVGHTLTLVYSNGLLASASDGTRTVYFAFSGGRLATATNAGGGVTSYAYDATQPSLALLVSRTLPGGNVPYTQVYDALSRVIRQLDALGNQTELTYDATNGRTTAVDPTGATQAHTHVDRALTDLRLENGQNAKCEYDADGRRNAVVDRLGARTSWSYDAVSRRVATHTAANGAITRWIWAARAAGGFTFQDLAQIVHPDGTKESFVHDAAGNLTTHTDAAGGVWTRTWSANGELLTETDPEGGTTTYAWNGDGTLASATDPTGRVTTFVHDGFGRLVEIRRPDGTTQAMTWDALDRVTSTTDEAGHVTEFAWDANGNLVSILLPDGTTWSFVHDAMDRLTGVIDPDGNVATSELDELGRLVRATDADGVEIILDWTTGGQLASVKDGHGAGPSFGHDLDDVVNTVTDAIGGLWSYVTDTTGRRTQSMSPNHRVRRVVRDKSGRVTQRFDGTGGRTDVAYDPIGRPESVTVPGLASAAIERDGAGRVTAYTRGSARWSRERDASGRVIGSTDPLGRSSSAQLDARGRPIHIDFPSGMGSVDLTWSEDSVLERAQWSDGIDDTYTHDTRRRLLTGRDVELVRDKQGRIVRSNGIDVLRDPAGRIVEIVIEPGISVFYEYDGAGLVTKISDSFGHVMTIVYDAARRPIRRVFPNGVVETREYDADGLLLRLLTTKADGTVLADLRYERDGEGRIVRITRRQPVLGLPVIGTTTRQYDDAGQEKSWTYDALGRRLDDGVHQYTYSLAGHLTGMVGDAWTTGRAQAGTQYEFETDALGRKSRFEWGAVNGRVFWNYGTERPSVALMTQDDEPVAYFASTPTGDLAWTMAYLSGAITCEHFDENGNAIFTTDDFGDVKHAYAYSPDGIMLARSGSAFDYPPAELKLGAQWFVLPLGTTYSYAGVEYDPTTASTLQPREPTTYRLGARWSPYALKGFPQPSSDPSPPDTSSSDPNFLESIIDYLEDEANFGRDSELPREGVATQARVDFWGPTIRLPAADPDGDDDGPAPAIRFQRLDEVGVIRSTPDFMPHINLRRVVLKLRLLEQFSVYVRAASRVNDRLALRADVDAAERAAQGLKDLYQEYLDAGGTPLAGASLFFPDGGGDLADDGAPPSYQRNRAFTGIRQNY